MDETNESSGEDGPVGTGVVSIDSTSAKPTPALANKNKANKKQQQKPVASKPAGKKNQPAAAAAAATAGKPKEGPTDSWEDEYLASTYSANKIIEVSYTINECEHIANKVLACVAGGQANMLNGVKALVRLAYNTLMDPNDGREPEELFFVKYKHFKESWQNVGRANAKEKVADGDTSTAMAIKGAEKAPRLQLIRETASVNQRKAAIGVWAMCHLRALIYSRECLQLFFDKKQTPSKIIEEIYKFENPYKFPVFDRDTYELLRQEFAGKKGSDPEVLYLFYRGAIILEHTMERPDLRSQKWLLLRVAYGNPNGLREHGLELYTWFKSAANELRVDLDQLRSDLIWALCDGPCNEHSNKSVETVMKLMEFHRKHYINEDSKKSSSSKYFMYARVVDGKFFEQLDADSNEELCSALVEICRMKGATHIPKDKVRPLWKERAQLLAKKICQRHTKQINTVVVSNKQNNDRQRASSQVREGRPANKNKPNSNQQMGTNSNQRATSQVRGSHQGATSVARNQNANILVPMNHNNKMNNNNSDKNQFANNNNNKVQQQKRASSQVRTHSSNNTAVTSLLQSANHDGQNRPTARPQNRANYPVDNRIGRSVAPNRSGYVSTVPYGSAAQNGRRLQPDHTAANGSGHHDKKDNCAII